MKNIKVIIPLVIALLAIVAYFIFNQWNKENVIIKEETVTPNATDAIENVMPVIQIEEVKKIPVEKEFPFSMTELDVQIAIHGMSHQKIRASNNDKWDLLFMTPERIERLIVVVEANNVRYRENLDTYLAILNRWKDNDFSRVDLDHNVIWSLQDGTRGKAIGIFTPEEEIEFIKAHYNVEIREVMPE